MTRTILPLKGVLFDKDGTLFDFQSTWGPWACGLVARLAEGAPDLMQRLAGRIGLDLTRQVFVPESVVIAGTNAQVVALLQAELPHMPNATLMQQMNAAGAQAVPNAAVPLQDCLGRLRAMGLVLGVATNDAEVSAVAQLDKAGVRGLFDFVAGYDSGFGGKPGPGMCHGFCDALGLVPAQVVMVGDSTHDLHAGRAAGMACVAVLTGVAGADELAPLADVVLPDIGHLAGWIARRIEGRIPQ